MKRALCLIMILLLLVVSGCVGIGQGGSDRENERTVAMPALRILYATAEAGSEAIIDAAERYEEMTGTAVEVTTFPYNNLQEKVFSELSQQSSRYDLIAVDTPWLPQIIRHLEPMSGYIRASEAGQNGIRLDDFIAKLFLDTSVFRLDAPEQAPPVMESVSLDAITSAGFEVWSLPVQSNALTVSYRSDLFEDPENREQFRRQFNRELAIPETMEEYLDIARFFTRDLNGDGALDLYGTTLMAGRHEANFVDYKSFLSSFGGVLFDADLKPAFDSKQGVQALETYGSWINVHKVTPPGVLDYTWDEVEIAFGFGQTAMGMNYHDMRLDPQVKGGKVGYFLFPGVMRDGKVMRGPHFGSWGIAINKYSANKQAAYELAAYLTGPEAQANALAFRQHVTRKSAYEQAKSLPDPAAREYYQVLESSLNVGVGRPRIRNYDQVSEAVQAAVQDYLTGKNTAEAALSEAAGKVERLMGQSGY